MLGKVAPGSVYQGARPLASGRIAGVAEYDPATATFYVPARFPAGRIPASRRAAFEETEPGSGVWELRLATGAPALSILPIGDEVLIVNPSEDGTVEGEAELVLFPSSEAGAEIDPAVVFSTSGGTVVQVRVPEFVEPPEVASVEVDPAEVEELLPGDTVQLTATPRDAEGGALPDAVTWSSGDEDVATVSATGLVTAVAGGEVEIRATTANGIYGACIVTVPATVASVEIDPATATVDEDATVQLTGTALDLWGNPLPDALTWATSDASIATVDSAGLVLGVLPGAAIVTAEAPNGVTGEAEITVVQPDVYVADFTAMPDGAPPKWTSYAVAGKLVGALTVSSGLARITNSTSNEHGMAVRNGTSASVGRARTRFSMSQLRPGFLERAAGLALLVQQNASMSLGFTGCRVFLDLTVNTGQFQVYSDVCTAGGATLLGPGGAIATIAGITTGTAIWLEAEVYYAGSNAHLRVRLWKDGSSVPAWGAVGTLDANLGNLFTGTTGAFGLAHRGTPPRFAYAEFEGNW